MIERRVERRSVVIDRVDRNHDYGASRMGGETIQSGSESRAVS